MAEPIVLGGNKPNPANVKAYQEKVAAAQSNRAISPTSKEMLQTLPKALEEEQKKEEEVVDEAKSKEAAIDYIKDSSLKTEAERVLQLSTRRKAIESRCSKMSIEDLIIKGEVRQTINIVPGKYWVEFRSTMEEESLFIKRRIAKETPVSNSHTLEVMALYSLCCGIVSVNGAVFPDHMKGSQPDEEMFNVKFKKLLSLSGYLIQDLSIQYEWFDVRIRKLMNEDDLGNG